MANAIASSSKVPIKHPASRTNSKHDSKPPSPSKVVVIDYTPMERELDSDDDFNEREIKKETPPPQDTKKGRKKSTTAVKQESSPSPRGKQRAREEPRKVSKNKKRTSGVKNESSGSDDEDPRLPQPVRAPQKKKGKSSAKKEEVEEIEIPDSTDEEDERGKKGKKGNGASDWEKKGEKKRKRGKGKPDTRLVNPLRLLAGDVDSDDFLTTDSEDDIKSEEKPVLDGSETEEEEVIVVNEDTDESDLGETDAFKARYPTLYGLPDPAKPTSQNSQGSQNSQPQLSLSQRQQQAAIPIVPVKSLPAQRNGALSSLEYKPVEATPYTPAQLARGSFPLTVDSRGPSIPQPLNRLLRDYQREGVQFLYKLMAAGRGGILGDDMGLGKTIQVISFLSAFMSKTGLKAKDDLRRSRWVKELKAQGKMREGICASNPKPGSQWPTALIIAPSSVCFNWERELSNWGYFSVGVYQGSDKHRILQEYKMGWYDIIIVGFETVSKDIHEFYDLDWGCIIADECHRIKNPRVDLTINLNKFHSKIRIGLTGTAIQNKLEEFWAILNWSNPGRLGTENEFKEYISRPIKAAQAIDADAETLATGRIRAFAWKKNILPQLFLRRTKAIIAHQLPKKTDLVVSCPMTSKQIECFQRLRETEDVQLMLTKDEVCDCGRYNSKGEPRLRKDCCGKTNSAGVAWNDLVFKYIAVFRKVANHLALVIPSDDDTPAQREGNRALLPVILPAVPIASVRYQDQSLDASYCGKWPHLRHFLDVWRPNGQPNKNKVLIFSMSVKLLKILEYFISVQGYIYQFMHGGVLGKDRMAMVDKFQDDPNQYIFLISTLTGGVGLNLTAANKVVIFDPSWNPANDLQAMDRAFRIGQTSDVEVYRFVASGSIEEVIYARQIYKRQGANVGYEASFEKRVFAGVMGDKEHEGELFGIKNLFSLREDGLGIKDTAQRAYEAEIEVKGLAAGRQFDESTTEMQFSQEEDARATDFNSVLALLNGTSGKEEDNEISKLLDVNGATFYHQDNLFIGNSEVEKHVFRAARKLLKERPQDASKVGAHENAKDHKFSPKKKAKRSNSTPVIATTKTSPGEKKKISKAHVEKMVGILPPSRPAIIAKVQEAGDDSDEEL